MGSAHDDSAFVRMVSNATTGLREYAYTEIKRDMDPFFRDDWAIRNDRYKLIQRLASEQELYDLEADPFEQDNLLANGSDVSVILAELQAQTNLIRQ